MSSYKTGKPERRDRGWIRKDTYLPTGGTDSVLIVDGKDLTPIYRGRHDERCSCCWLGYAHSEDQHNERIKPC